MKKFNMQSKNKIGAWAHMRPPPLCKPSHHKSQVPKGPLLQASFTQHYIWKSIHSVYNKILKRFFEVYDTDSPVGEVLPLNINFER